MRFIIGVTQHTNQDTGSIRHILYGSPNYLDGLIDYDGCPHNGGEHSLSLKAPRGDIIAWLEMLLEMPEFKTKFHEPDPWLKICLDHAKNPRNSLASYHVRKEVFKEVSRKKP